MTKTTAVQQRNEDSAASDESNLCRLQVCAPDCATDAGVRFIGSGDAMAVLADRIERVALSSAPVLITGETGSGKDVTARAVHAWGPRHDRPFVAVNVAAIPEPLLESEIFGHVRGAFSGANDARRGLFAAAHTGTLFLDEIGEMPPRLQAKLLRGIELGEVRAVGADAARKVDVRIVAATHRNLAKLVREGQFREDLFFRLNVLSIAVPPLRDRQSDIRELAAHFLAEAQQRAPGTRVRALSPEALTALSTARWPGNIRELANVIERLVVFGREEIVTQEHVADILTAEAPDAEDTFDHTKEYAAEALSDDVEKAACTLDHVTRRHVARVLKQSRGCKKLAAKRLGIHLSTLYRWERATGTEPRAS